MSTTPSNKHASLQLRIKPPKPPVEFVEFVVLSAAVPLLLQFLYFKFQPKKGMRPMTKERIHKIAMISLAVFPVINSLYLEKTNQMLKSLEIECSLAVIDKQ